MSIIESRNLAKYFGKIQPTGLIISFVIILIGIGGTFICYPDRDLEL